MPIKLNGSTSGYTELTAPATAGNNTLTLPTGNGSADQVLGTNGSGSLSWVDRGRMVLSSVQNSTSGTAIDFTGIPSWARRVTLIFNTVSLSGTSSLLIQLGSGSITSSGYVSLSAGTNNVGLTSTSGFIFTIGTAALGLYGHMVITQLSGNAWIQSHQGALSGSSVSEVGGGGVTLSGTLDRIRITTVNGTDTFDAGSINILIEG